MTNRPEDPELRLAQRLRDVDESSIAAAARGTPAYGTAANGTDADDPGAADLDISQLTEQEQRDWARAQAALRVLQRQQPRGLDQHETRQPEDTPQSQAWAQPSFGRQRPVEGDSASGAESVSAGPVSAESVSPGPVSPGSALPDRLGRFEILGQLGQGGFAYVLLARDPNLDRRVAIKIPKPNLIFSAEAQQRFLREARLAAILSHPAIVPVYESGQIGPVTYIATAYCPGGTLAQWLADRGQPLEPRQAARLVARLADAVQHAHSRHVIHRDLKPGNLLLDAAAPDALPFDSLIAALRISDFGLAKLHLEQSDLSQSDALIGTPAYMSPEQAVGDTARIGPASDIYALGAILYQLLVGRPPHRAESYLGTLRAIERDEPIPPRRVNPAIPKDLDAICLKALAKDPAERYATASDLDSDLRRYLNGEPIVARHATPIERVAKWARRNRSLATIGGIAAASLLIGFGVALWQWSRAEQHLEQSQQQAARADRHLARLENSIDRIMVDATRFLNEIPGSESLRRELIENTLAIQQDLLAEESDDPLVQFRTAQAWRRIGESHRLLGEYTESLNALQQARDQLDVIAVGPDDTEWLQEKTLVLYLLAQTLYNSDQIQAGIDAAELAIQSADALFAVSPNPETATRRAEAWRMLGMCQERFGQVAEAAETFRAAIEILPADLEVLAQIDPAIRDSVAVCLANCLNSLGICEKALGNLDEARLDYARSFDLLQTQIELHPARVDLQGQLAATALNLGNLTFARRQYGDAEDWYAQSADISQRLIQDFPQTVRFRHLFLFAEMGRSLAQKNSGQIDAAIATAQNCIELSERYIASLGASPTILANLSKLYGNLANLYLDQRPDPDAAQEALENGVRLSRELAEQFPENAGYSLSYSVHLGRLGSVQRRQAQYERALETLDQALAVGSRVWQKSPGHRESRDNMVWALTEKCRVAALADEPSLAIETAQRITDLAPAGFELDLQAAGALGWCLLISRGESAADSAASEQYLNQIVPLLDGVLDSDNPEMERSLHQSFESAPFNQLQDVPQLQRFMSQQ